jgi:hypothetical protein
MELHPSSSYNDPFWINANFRMMFGHTLGTCHASFDLWDGIFKCLRKLNGDEHNIQLFDPSKTPSHGRKPVTKYHAASMHEIHHWARASRRILGTEERQYEIGRREW